MTCYKDRIWCSFGLVCKASDTCARILTEKDKEEAQKKGLYIAYYTDFPDCFVRFFEPEETK